MHLNIVCKNKIMSCYCFMLYKDRKNNLCKNNRENILMSDECLWILRKSQNQRCFQKFWQAPLGCIEMPSTWTGKIAREAGFDLKTLTSCYSCLDMAGAGRTLKLQGMKSSLNSRKSCEGQHETSKQNCRNSFMKNWKRNLKSRTEAHHWLSAGFLLWLHREEKLLEWTLGQEEMYNHFNSLFFHTNYGLEFKVALHSMFKMVTRNNFAKFFMNSGIAREKTGALGSTLSVCGPIRLLIQHLPLVLWMMGMTENQSIEFCYEQRTKANNRTFWQDILWSHPRKHLFDFSTLPYHCMTKNFIWIKSYCFIGCM